jgi:hypothetical protein
MWPCNRHFSQHIQRNILLSHTVPATFAWFFFGRRQRYRELLEMISCLFWHLLTGHHGLSFLFPVQIPLYVVNFHRYPVGEARSTKDFIVNLADLEGVWCLNHSMPFHRVQESPWGHIFPRSVEIAGFSIQAFQNQISFGWIISLYLQKFSFYCYSRNLKTYERN